jgi:ribosome biogenesis GTPase A
MTIQWFPGHMTRAKRQIEEKLKLIDVVLELLDARLPLSSRNPMIDDIVKGKPRVVLLNKSDLADPELTRAWVQSFAERDIEALPIDASTGTQVREIVPKCQELLREKRERMLNKGIKPRPIRALIVGIPNVGKSTLINRLAGRNIAATGDRPGITKGQQWIKVGQDMELLDTPGILWPKFDDSDVGFRLAASGAIKDEILHAQDIVFHTLRYLLELYPDRLKERFELERLPGIPPEPEEIVELMEHIGRKRGCLISGGRVDLDKASQLILRDLRSGRLGRITLERP